MENQITAFPNLECACPDSPLENSASHNGWTTKSPLLPQIQAQVWRRNDTADARSDSFKSDPTDKLWTAKCRFVTKARASLAH